jgi:hypothetical protein
VEGILAEGIWIEVKLYGLDGTNFSPEEWKLRKTGQRPKTDDTFPVARPGHAEGRSGAPFFIGDSRIFPARRV